MKHSSSLFISNGSINIIMVTSEYDIHKGTLDLNKFEVLEKSTLLMRLGLTHYGTESELRPRTAGKSSGKTIGYLSSYKE